MDSAIKCDTLGEYTPIKPYLGEAGLVIGPNKLKAVLIYIKLKKNYKGP